MSELSARAISHYISDVFTDEKPAQLELSVFVLKDGKNIDLGAMCYRVFEFDNAGKNKATDQVRLTDLKTFDKRRLVFVSRFIDSLRLQNHLLPSSKRSLILRVMRFICWLGSLEFDVNFCNQSDIKKAYQEYTIWLYHRMKLKDGERLKLTNNSASQEQKAARYACALMADINVKTVEYWATPIRHTDREKFTGTLTDSPTTDEDRFLTYAALCDFIHQVWMLWVKKEQEQIKVNDAILFDHMDLYNEGRKEEIFNKAIVAALLSFIGASGANLQVATNATMDKFDYGQTVKNSRLAGIKSRARNKTVYPEFSLKYLNVWKKWLDIREMWLSSHNATSDITFPYLGDGDTIRPIPGSLTDVTKSAPNMFILKYGVTWITARAWRGFKSKLLSRVNDNDIQTAAEMQGHSIKTALISYSNRSLADAAMEISNALNSVYTSAITRCRNREIIPVALVEAHNPEQETVIGGCLSETELAPAIADGFTNYAPQPDCSIKETCLFCEKYAAHADETDVRKLLSFKFLANELAEHMPQNEWAGKWSPYIHRVEEILEQMKSINPDISKVIDKVSEEIDYGELDEFWMNYHETLSYLGVISA